MNNDYQDLLGTHSEQLKTNKINYLQQLEKDKIIERQIRFQELLISISTQYINSDLSDINNLINK